MPKNAQTTAQLHSSHMLEGNTQNPSSQASTVCELRTSRYKSWIQAKAEELYKKGLNDLDNHDGVVSHLELDMLECEVKWALGSITTKKAGGSDGITAELFKS